MPAPGIEYSAKVVRKCLVVSLLNVSIVHSADDTVGPWKKSDLFAVPKHYPSDQFSVPGVQSIMYEGLAYKGKRTRFYAYYRAPEGKTPEGGWPAVVCVHGGGGTASPGQVQGWGKHGYAAISMDLEGHLPKPGVPHNKRPGHDWSGPARAGNFEESKINNGVPSFATRWTMVSATSGNGRPSRQDLGRGKPVRFFQKEHRSSISIL